MDIQWVKCYGISAGDAQPSKIARWSSSSPQPSSELALRIWSRGCHLGTTTYSCSEPSKSTVPGPAAPSCRAAAARSKPLVMAHCQDDATAQTHQDHEEPKSQCTAASVTPEQHACFKKQCATKCW